METSPTPRDWLNQSLKVEPGFAATATSRRVVCGSGSGSSSAYFSSTSTAHFESIDNNMDYTAFTIPRLGGSSNPPHTTFPCHHHAFGPPPLPPPGPSPSMVPLHSGAPLPDTSGTLARAHAMHSFFESYTTFESGTARQHTSVRMDQHILPQKSSSGHCRKDSGSSNEDPGKGATSGVIEASSGSTVVSRASYMCRKCKAHGQAVPVKRHKRACPYLQCRCLKCRLVDQGRKASENYLNNNNSIYSTEKFHLNSVATQILLTPPNANNKISFSNFHSFFQSRLWSGPLRLITCICTSILFK